MKTAFRFLAAMLFVFFAPAHGAKFDADTVVLVARAALHGDFLYARSILIVKPIGADRHMGFILNKPTHLTLGEMYPDHAPSQKVKEPIRIGGPINSHVLFAIVKRSIPRQGKAFEFLPDLYAIAERDGVDHAIEHESVQSRFFAGFVLWDAGELRAELERSFWYVVDADSSLLLEDAAGMWKALYGQAQKTPI